MKVVPEETVLAGRYRLGERLGRGGMADVFDAFDERLHRRVAVKLLRPAMAVRPDIRIRFEDEARAAARLSHPNVVGVHDTGEEGGTPFIVMERLPGETLGDRMAAGPMDPAWVRRMAGDVLLALAAAHEAGIIHRDVKPGNILLAPDGCAKVADFGIAKSLEMDGDLTATNQLMGTPAYLAPERIDGRPATPASDIYALGVVLYEALAGAKPFGGDTPMAVAYNVQHARPVPLTQLRPGLPGDLVEAAERAMARDPGSRFVSADAMAAALGMQPPLAAVGEDEADATIASVPMDPTLVGPAALPPPPPAAAPVKATRFSTLSVGSGGGFGELAHRVRREWRVVATAAGVLMLVIAFLIAIASPRGTTEPAATAANRPAASTTVAANPVSAGLRETAAGLGAADGRHAAEATTRLDAVADAVDRGAGTTEANALLASLPAWYGDGGLTRRAFIKIGNALLQVPGTDDAVLVPTTAPPEGHGKKDKHNNND